MKLVDKLVIMLFSVDVVVELATHAFVTARVAVHILARVQIRRYAEGVSNRLKLQRNCLLLWPREEDHLF